MSTSLSEEARGTEEVSKVLLSGLIEQSEISHLLDELYDDLDDDLGQARWEIVNHASRDRDEGARASTNRYELEPELV